MLPPLTGVTMQCVQNLAICLEVSRAADIKGSGSEMLSKSILGCV
jgi:hypothetical protein